MVFEKIDEVCLFYKSIQLTDEKAVRLGKFSVRKVIKRIDSYGPVFTDGKLIGIMGGVDEIIDVKLVIVTHR